MYNDNYKWQKQKDMDREHIINMNLASKFYDKYLNTKGVITDKKMQISGIDLKTDKDVNIDVKNALSYGNGDLKTFVLEILFRDSGGSLYKGWYLDAANHATDYYSFNYFTHVDSGLKNKEDTKFISDWEDVGNVEMVIVSKKKLLEYTKDIWTKELRLLMKKTYMEKTSWVKLTEDLSLSYSDKLKEKPLNILINKKVLINLSDIHVFYEPDIFEDNIEWYKNNDLIK